MSRQAALGAHLLVGLALAPGLAVVTAPAHAQEASTVAEASSGGAAASTAGVAAAERLAEEAFEAYQAKRYIDAVALYRQAYQAAPSADMLYNLARIYDVGLRDGPLAIDFYRQYIADAAAEPERVRRANERLLALREEAAAVTVDPAERPEREPAPSTSTPVSEPAQASLSGLQVGGMVVVAAGLVGVGVGVRYGLVALDDADAAQAACDGNACRSQAGIDAARSAKDNALLSTIGYAAGAGLLALGIAMWVVGDEGDAAPSTASVTLAPVLSPQVGGVRLEGVLP